MFEMTEEEYQEWGDIWKPASALLELFVLCNENSYDWLVNNPDQLHPYLNYLLGKMTKELFFEYKLSYEQIVNKQFERMEEDDNYDWDTDTSADDRLEEITQAILAEE